ncbi:MAG: pantetheine-phosphate adenylyltransferase [Rhodospirillaceae bacterium]|nr:pantetheine-phosphate adenylyltransferase [Rhodospirillaceae bacterium]
MDKRPLVAVYPGTFDPITYGHTDIIRRAARLVDRLVIGVSVNAGKGPLFSIDERTQLVREEVAALGEAPVNADADGNGPCGPGRIEPAPRAPGAIEVRSFDNLLVQFAAEVGASMIIRGLRAVSDFDYEFQMAGMNARLCRTIDTVFLMASDRYQFISSRFVKEIGRLGGNISPFVSPRIAERVYERFGRRP